MLFLNEFFIKVDLEKIRRRRKNMQNYPVVGQDILEVIQLAGAICLRKLYEYLIRPTWFMSKLCSNLVMKLQTRINHRQLSSELSDRCHY